MAAVYYLIWRNRGLKKEETNSAYYSGFVDSPDFGEFAEVWRLREFGGGMSLMAKSWTVNVREKQRIPLHIRWISSNLAAASH